MTASFDALGTTITVATVDPGRTSAAHEAAKSELADFDRACSRFRDDSELSRVSASSGATVSVGPILLEALEVALAAAQATGGLVDPTVGRALRLAGYDATFRLVAARDPEQFTPRYCVSPGWQTVELDRDRATVRVPAGVELDLGATGKALAADRAARAAADEAGCGVLVSAGGDVAVAGAPPAGGWPIRISDDHATPLDAPGPVVSITEGGLATSSTTVRRWGTRTGACHHVFDPRTGRPAGGPWRTVSVAAATCVDANTASTAAFILGEDAVSWLSERGLPARLERSTGSTELVADWPDDRR